VNGRLCTGWYSAGGTATIRGGTVVSPGIAKGLYGFAGGTVNISGGTVTVGSDGIANGNTGGGVVISGGSVNVAGTMGSMPTNGSANGSQEVYLTQPRLDNVKTVTAVSALTLSNASYYGMKDLYTDADGTLYLYLPADAAATGVQAAGRTYVGSVAAGESGALALPATDSALSGLALSHGTLDPAFDPATTGYAVSVPYGVTGVTVTPTVSDPGRATVTVNGVAAESGSATGEIPLSVGDNAIQVVFTADTVTQTTYTITVTRSGAPVISAQPTDKTVAEGQKATFTVEASGTEPLSYQWYVDREGVKGWVKIDSASARTATYTTSATKLEDSGYRYACLVENAAGSIRSDAVTLTVIEKSSPQTGDDSNLPLWIVLALLSGLGLAALLTAGRRGFNRR
jgi:hypothetical protein